MKVLSVRQPYASLIMRGVKRYEARTWSTEHRGPLLIHASSSQVSGPFIEEIELQRPFFEAVTSQGWTTDRALRELPRSAILGVVDLVSVEDGAELDEAEVLTDTDKSLVGSIDENTKLWRLENPLEIEPLSIKGRLNLWSVDSASEREVERRIGAARRSRLSGKMNETTVATSNSDGRPLVLRLVRPSKHLAKVVGPRVRTEQEIMDQLIGYVLDHELDRRGRELRVALDDRLAFLAPGQKTMSWQRLVIAVSTEHLSVVQGRERPY